MYILYTVYIHIISILMGSIIILILHIILKTHFLPIVLLKYFNHLNYHGYYHHSYPILSILSILSLNLDMHHCIIPNSILVSTHAPKNLPANLLVFHPQPIPCPRTFPDFCLENIHGLLTIEPISSASSFCPYGHDLICIQKLCF